MLKELAFVDVSLVTVTCGVDLCIVDVSLEAVTGVVDLCILEVGFTSRSFYSSSTI
jgi:hypothetical protein